MPEADEIGKDHERREEVLTLECIEGSGYLGNGVKSLALLMLSLADMLLLSRLCFRTRLFAPLLAVYGMIVAGGLIDGNEINAVQVQGPGGEAPGEQQDRQGDDQNPEQPPKEQPAAEAHQYMCWYCSTSQGTFEVLRQHLSLHLLPSGSDRMKRPRLYRHGLCYIQGCTFSSLVRGNQVAHLNMVHQGNTVRRR